MTPDQKYDLIFEVLSLIAVLAFSFIVTRFMSKANATLQTQRKEADKLLDWHYKQATFFASTNKRLEELKKEPLELRQILLESLEQEVEKFKQDNPYPV